MIYQLRKARSPFWGDYGSVLIHGSASRTFADVDKSDVPDPLPITRSGPYVPPITFPSMLDVIVTDDLKIEIESWQLPEIRFRPAYLEKVVDIPWHLWDRSQPFPPVLPESGEPEDFLLKGAHSPALLSEMPTLWELQLDRVDFATAQSREWCSIKTQYGTYVSENVKERLLATVSMWIRTIPFPELR